MHAYHSTLLPSSAIHHSLYLAHFTPSTIYPLPKPHAALEVPDVKVVGNLVVAGGQDLRVFEIREESAPLPDDETTVSKQEDMDVGDSFFDAAPVERAPVRYQTTRKLHLLTRHTLHGIITGLAGLRTIDSSVDGLDRLLVSFEHAKVRQVHRFVYQAEVADKIRWRFWSGPEEILRPSRCTRTSVASR